MSQVHYFPRYSQRENVVTNNTLLLLLRLRDFSRLRFEKFMESLCADEDQDIQLAWLRFSQQKVASHSVIDGFLAQDSLRIAVETKRVNTFDVNQLNNHLAVFGPEQHKILILLSPSLSEAATLQLEEVRGTARQMNIHVIATTFESIVAMVRSCLSPSDEEMLSLVADFEDYCSDENLLPRDDFTIFVPPCGYSFEDNIRLHLYHCPAAWTRRKTKYLGIYHDKSIQAIGQISRVLACTVDRVHREVTPLPGQGGPVTPDEKEHILQATEAATQHGWDTTTDNKFYLLEPLELTDFQKTSSGGIQGHRYIDLEDILGRGGIPPTLRGLADALRNHTWQ
jgi:hypothetical protein